MPTATATTTTPTSSSIAARLIEARERIYAEKQAVCSDGSYRPVWPVGLTQERGRVLAQLIADEQAQTCIETGLAYALSSSFLLEGMLKNCTAGKLPRLVSIDPFQTSPFKRAGLIHLEHAGANALHEFYEEPSERVLPRLLENGRRFDAAFIDGDHRFEYVFVDVFYCRRLLPEGGLIVLDDAWMASVQKCAAFFTSAGLCTLAEPAFADPALSKFLLLRVCAVGDERAWDSFAAF